MWQTIIVLFQGCTLRGKKAHCHVLINRFLQSFYSWARSPCSSLKLNSWRTSRNATFGKCCSPSSGSRNEKRIPSLNNRHTEKKGASHTDDLFPIPETKFTAAFYSIATVKCLYQAFFLTCVEPLVVHAHGKDQHQSSSQAFSPNL